MWRFVRESPEERHCWGGRISVSWRVFQEADRTSRGFGIKSRGQVESLLPYVDAAVVGSHLVGIIAKTAPWGRRRFVLL
jgi:hypothetical protein